jgi:hypothetical protein
MARRAKMSVLKRQRELRKAEKQATKRELKKEREPEGGQKVATREDLEGYGFPDEAAEEPAEN